jgi:uncharacterized delta-60 repeat protein
MRTDVAHEIVWYEQNQIKNKNKEKTVKKATLLSITGLLAFGLMFGVTFSQAQSIGGRGAGSLDPTFGTGGTVTSRLGAPMTPVTAFQQSTGNIVAITGIGNVSFPSVSNFGLVRYTSTGTLIGVTSVAFGSNLYNNPIAAAVQPNGDIIVAGTSASVINEAQEFALARFTPNGQLDPTFGNGGLVTTTFSNPCCDTFFMSFSSLLLQPNGQIVVGGSAPPDTKHGPGMTVLARYNPNGSLDTTFGAGGTVEEVPAAVNPAALALLTDGSYLAAGGPSSVVEFSSTGVLQSTVTPGTVEAANQSASGCCSQVLFQPNGDYLVAQLGPGLGRRGSDVQVFRFSETGVLDTTFNSTPFTFGGNTQNTPQTIALQTNGQIVLGGLTNDHGTPVTGGLARLDSNGELDTTFADGGGLVSEAAVAGLLIQTDGKIVAVGNVGDPGNRSIVDLSISRYLGH